MSRWNITWEDTLGSVSCVHITMKNKCIEARLFFRRNSGFCFWKWVFFSPGFESLDVSRFLSLENVSLRYRRGDSIQFLNTAFLRPPHWFLFSLNCLEKNCFCASIEELLAVTLYETWKSPFYENWYPLTTLFSLSNKLFQWFSLSLLVKYFRI